MVGVSLSGYWCHSFCSRMRVDARYRAGMLLVYRCSGLLFLARKYTIHVMRAEFIRLTAEMVFHFISSTTIRVDKKAELFFFEAILAVSNDTPILLDICL